MEHHSIAPLYVAIDVGTGSVRSAIFSSKGEKCTSTRVQPIKTRNALPYHYEQATNGPSGVWAAVVATVRAACDELAATEQHGSCATRKGSQIADGDLQSKGHAARSVRQRIAGIGFDATCSLVAVDSRTGMPVSVIDPSPRGTQIARSVTDETPTTDVYDIVLWLDHRAIKETAEINSNESADVDSVRRHFGGKLSPENQPGKLLCLKRCMPPDIWASTSFYDLADWLAFKCIGTDIARSSCTTACKWGWGSGDIESGWNARFWNDIGLADLTKDNNKRIGSRVVAPGTCLGTLCEAVAMELELPPHVVVAAPLIDAHCGALGMLSPGNSELLAKYAPSVEERLAMVCGTSTCHLAISREKLFVNGVWGPFQNAIVDGYWVTEGGQSATGALLDYIIGHASVSKVLQDEATQQGKSIYSVLENILAEHSSQDEDDPCQDLHILPYFHGNRSPRADPTLRGCISGLTLASSEAQARKDLALMYKATIQALAYGARHIIEEMNNAGHRLKAIIACGGLAKSELFMAELADACNMPVFGTHEPDAVLSGAAILAASAAEGGRTRLEDLMSRMTSLGDARTYLPNPSRNSFHNRKYQVFLKMYEDQIMYRNIIRGQNQ